MGGSLGCHRSIPADPVDRATRKLSAACNFGHMTEPPPPERLDLNRATEEELMTLPGVSRAVARSVVQYRRCIGGFRRVEDLALVSGVGAARLEAMRPEVCVSQASPASLSPGSLHSEESEAGGPAGGPAGLAAASPRACVAEAPCGLRQGRPVLRAASWSLQRCSWEKANNPGVKEVVCMTLLENDIKLLAVQDLADREALDKFCAELNQATLPSVLRWRGPRGTWKCVVSEKPTAQTPKGDCFSGFLWNSTCGIELKDVTVLEGPVANGNGKHAHPRPYMARFAIGASQLTVVNVHLVNATATGEQNGKKHGEPNRSLQLAGVTQDMLKGERDLLVLGDFSLPADTSELELLRKEKLTALVPPTQFTNISTRMPQGSHCLDNIWVSRTLRKIYTGHCWVVREGLTNPWIPDNWSWGGVASDHCPVAAEFYMDAFPKEALLNGVAPLDRTEGDKHER